MQNSCSIDYPCILSIMLLFVQCSWPTPCIILYHFLGWIFSQSFFFSRIFLRLVYLWIWCSMISLMLRLVILLVVPDDLFAHILLCTILLGQLNKIFGIINHTIEILHWIYCMLIILVGQLNKIFGLITHTIKSLHGLYCMVFKNMWFLWNIKYNLVTGLHGVRIKISCLSGTLVVWINFL